MAESCVVDTEFGAVRGALTGGVKTWKGVPYAASPAGERRWRKPVEPEPWTAVKDATEFGPVSPQPNTPVAGLPEDAPQDEDCLSVNVWAPDREDADQPLPVMVWIHGGAFVFGGTCQPVFDATALVESGEVIVVSMNYRLGALGWLDLSSYSNGQHEFDTNLALHDVVFALRWVQRNIEKFGGDPNQVTIFGESAGGSIVTALLAIPQARNLFIRAIAQSSPVTSAYGAERARSFAARFLELCEVEPDAIAQLRTLPVEKIIESSMKLYNEIPAQSPGVLAFAPIIDGDFLPEAPVSAAKAGRTTPVPLIIGTNHDEASAFAHMSSPLLPVASDTIRKMFADMTEERPDIELPTESIIGSAYIHSSRKSLGTGIARDIGFRLPSVWFAEGHSQVAPVHLYRFDWATPFLKLIGLGATHSTELPYLFGNLVQGSKDVTFKLGGLRTGKTISARMQKRWIGFAVSGVPNAGASGPDWPQFSPNSPNSLLINRRDEIAHDIDAEILRAWGQEALSFT